MSDIFNRELRDTAREADDAARMMSVRLDQSGDRQWVVATEIIGGLAGQLRRFGEFNAKLAHEATLVERIEKIAYAKLGD